MIFVYADELEGGENFRISNGKMRFEVQMKLMRENSGGRIPVHVAGGSEGEIIVSGDPTVKPRLQLKSKTHD